MTALLAPNSSQTPSAIPCLEKIAVCANEPQKLLIPKELHPQNNPEIPSKTPKIPSKTPQITQKTAAKPHKISPTNAAGRPSVNDVAKLKVPNMHVGVIVFPGSNCDHDAWYAVNHNLGHKAEFIWHDSTDLGNADAIILPGGFSYGDYMRCGAIARFSPVMNAVKKFAADGGLVLGICNGFQILVETGLLPGALMRNANLHFLCKDVELITQTANSPFTSALHKGQTLRLPIAHGEGSYYADDRTLDELEAEDRVVFRYKNNPNGSLRDIAGILNAGRNVMGMMPHPERACDPLMGSTDGVGVFESLFAAVPVA
jgi:phosphoribosylformylglycinamidine synthase subunit PurQ / glutaminase